MGHRRKSRHTRGRIRCLGGVCDRPVTITVNSISRSRKPNCCQDWCVKNGSKSGMRHIRQHMTYKEGSIGKIDSYNKPRICRNMSVNETVDTPVTSTCLSVHCLELKINHMWKKLLYTKSAAICKHHMQVKLEYCYIGKESWRQSRQNQIIYYTHQLHC
jgi:hypothetical protein